MTETVTLTLANATDAPPVERSVPRRLGPVVLECEIGRGAMGVVFRGRHEILGRDVAVKLLLHTAGRVDDPQFDRFRAEARVAAAVRHPHLTMIHHADVAEGVPYLVMDFIDGPSLATILERSGALPLDAALALAWAMSEAVAELHRSGVIHRDIKPRNTLLDRDGTVFVTDFGLALTRTLSGASTAPAGVAGTPTYMAPEMFEGLVSPRSDVYALGITTFELLTGRPPFSGSLLEVQKQHVGSPLPVAALEDRGVPPAIIDALERATHKNATFRHKSADYYRQALEAVTEESQRAGGQALLKDLAARFIDVQTPPTVVAPTSTTPTTTYFDLLGEVADQKRRRLGEKAPSISVRPSQTDAGSSSGGDVAQQPVAIAAIRRSEETNDPRRILRLQRCPQCDYDLSTLPEEHRCPECGFAYDCSMFAVYGWTRKERFSIQGRLLLGTWTERALAIVILAALASAITGMAFDAYRSWKTGSPRAVTLPGLIPFIFVAALVGVARLRSHVRRSREQHWGTIQLLFTRAGASKRRGPGEPRFVPWERFRRLRFRKLRSIRAGKRLWRLRLTVPFFRWFRWEQFEALVECTPREAALMRAEIRRRLQPANP